MQTSKVKLMQTSSRPPTWNNGKDILTYILRVLDLADDSPLVQALDIEGREDITSFLEISEMDITDLQYFKDGIPTIVPKFQKSRIRTFFGYIAYRKLQKTQLELTGLQSL